MRVRFLPFLLLHIRQSLVTYLSGRVLLTFAMGLARQPVVGVEYLILMPLLTVLLLHADRRRSGARDLFANLGFGARELLGTGAAVALTAELVLQAVARTALPAR